MRIYSVTQLITVSATSNLIKGLIQGHMTRGLRRARTETLIIPISYFKSFYVKWRIFVEGSALGTHGWAALWLPRCRIRAQCLQVLWIYSKVAGQLVVQIIWLTKRPASCIITIILVIAIKFIARCMDGFLCFVHAGPFLLLFGLEKIAEKGPCPRWLMSIGGLNDSTFAMTLSSLE